MLLEIGLIAGGIPAGWGMRHCPRIVRWVNEFLSWTVRIMLFLLGLALGLDDNLIGQLESLGLYALVISSFYFNVSIDFLINGKEFEKR